MAGHKNKGHKPKEAGPMAKSKPIAGNEGRNPPFAAHRKAKGIGERKFAGWGKGKK